MGDAGSGSDGLVLGGPLGERSPSIRSHLTRTKDTLSCRPAKYKTKVLGSVLSNEALRHTVIAAVTECRQREQKYGFEYPTQLGVILKVI